MTTDKKVSAPITKTSVLPWAGLCLTAVVLLLCPTRSLAQYTETTLYSFCALPGCPTGSNIGGAFVADPQGNLYGTSDTGGVYDLGTVYELSPLPGGGAPWTNTVLYSFCPQGPPCADGNSPQSGVIRDAHGNLYGTTITGGSRFNQGTVFELSPPPGGNGPWTESVLYEFCANDNCVDGNQPLGGLTLDSHGNLYGTTTAGGPHGQGVVFELSPSGGGQWTYTILYGFCALTGCADGRTPQFGSLVFDACRQSLWRHPGGRIAELRHCVQADSQRRVVDGERAAQLLFGRKLYGWRGTHWRRSSRCARQHLRRHPGRWHAEFRCGLRAEPERRAHGQRPSCRISVKTAPTGITRSRR